MKAIDTNGKYSSTSNTTERPKMSGRKGASVLGDTPLGRDLIFRSKISNTTSPPKKLDKAEEKEKLLMKYAVLDNNLLNNDGKKRTKTTYLSGYNSNWTARGRTQSLNFVPKFEATILKEKPKNKTFAPRTFSVESTKDNVFARDRAQSLNIVLQGSESVKKRAMNERTARNHGRKEKTKHFSLKYRNSREQTSSCSSY